MQEPLPSTRPLSRKLPTSAATAALPMARQVLRDSYGLTGRLLPLAGEWDANFRVGTGRGRYLLKLCHPQQPPARIGLQVSALQHLARHAPELPVPRIIENRAGAATTVVPAGPHQNEQRRALLLSFLPGQPMSDTVLTRAQMIPTGTLLGQLDLALAKFPEDADAHELPWDIRHVMTLRPIATTIADPARRQLLLQQFDRHEAQVQPHLGALPWQWIHNDFNPYNLLVDGEDHARLTGIVDFGDIVFSRRLNDLAIAASYHLDGDDTMLGRAGLLVGAFHRVAPLSETEQSLLGDLIAARLLTTICITESRAREHPENRRYILRNNPSAWRGLERLAQFPRSAVRDTVHNLCEEV